MGVSKLNKFMSSSSGWCTVQVTGKVVIDGTSLCYCLNSRHEWRYGGDYKEFYCTVIEYFRELVALGIEPYVIMDGMDPDDSKYQTYIKRNEERINHIASCQTQGIHESKSTVRPLFTQAVFVDALKAMEIKFLIADGEADRDIASLANSLPSPVISNDSDFFIFNIHMGYIPLTSGPGSLVDLRDPVRCFKYKDFDACLNLNNDQRLYIPFIAGNDFHSGVFLPQLGVKPQTQIRQIILKIRKAGLTCISDSELHPLGGDSAVKQMGKIRAYYRMKPHSYEDLASTKTLRELYPHAPDWIMVEYKRGNFMPPIMSLATCPVKRWRHTIVVEDFSQPSAWKITSISKKFIIGAILGAQGSSLDVSKTVVKNSHIDLPPRLSLVDEKIRLDHKHLNILPVPLGDLPTIPVSDRREIMLRVFHYKESAESALPDDLQLAMIASHCWIHNSIHNSANIKQLIESLICCILTCFSHFPSPVLADHQTCKPRGEEVLSLVHSYAQWQCILHHVIAFNQVLGHPFPYTSPAKLFSSRVLMHFYQQEQERTQTMADKLALSMFRTIEDRAPKRLHSPADTQVTGDVEPPAKKRHSI